MKKPNVLILYTGGTFGMNVQKGSTQNALLLGIPLLSAAQLRKRLHDQVPELQHIAHCHVEILLNRDSAHIGPEEWLLIARKIQTNWKKYSGVVLLHGTDTLTYTASALSFLLRPCLKPVIITGAQRPLSALRTDARTNLISAVEIAANGPRLVVNQVTVVFGSQLFQGNRIRKKSAVDFAAFESPHFPPLAVIGTTIRYSNQPLMISRYPHLVPIFDKKVMIVHITPGFPAEILAKSFLNDLHGFILVAFHSGTAPTHSQNFLEFLRLAKRRQIPVIIVTEGSTQPPSSKKIKIRYAAGNDLISEGCFGAGAMTPECAFIKTSLLLGQTKKLSEFSKLWTQNLAGEDNN